MAAPAASLSLSGLDEVQAILKSMPSKMVKQALRPAVEAGCRSVTRAARRNLKRGHGVETGLLKQSIGPKIIVKRKKGFVLGMVGARTGFKGRQTKRSLKNTRTRRLRNKRNPANYAHLVEKGHRIARGGSLSRLRRGRLKVGSGHSVGVVAPRPFLLPAFSGREPEITNDIRDKLNKFLAKQRAKGKL